MTASPSFGDQDGEAVGGYFPYQLSGRTVQMSLRISVTMIYGMLVTAALISVAASDSLLRSIAAMVHH